MARVLLFNLLLVVFFAYVTANQPHILFILADDYGWNDIGYHQSEIPTPNLDALAKDGVKLENYYVQPVCTPSRASIMTGRYPIRYGLQHGVIQAPQAAGLFLNETTLATKMRQAGYATHAIGKWHLGFFDWKYTPTYRGFDSHVGYFAGGEDYVSHNATWVYTGFDFRNNTQNYVEAKGEYSSSVFGREAVRIIDGYAAASPADRKPLFIYLAMQTCHVPLEVPPEFEEMCSFIKDNDRRIYCGMTVNMDLTIANVTRALAKAGILNNTLIVFSTDNGGLPTTLEGHGGASNWPLRGGKFTLWEGGVHGTAFVSGAGVPKSRAGSTYDGLMHVSDWFSTILHVAEGSTNDTQLPLDSVDMWEAITTGGASPRTEVLHNLDEKANNSALRSGDWKIVVGRQPYDGWFPPAGPIDFSQYKLHVDAPNTISLFNITADPAERNDLSSQHPQVVKRLLSRIGEFRTQLVPAWNMPNDPAANPKHFGGNWMPWK